ncbi:pre-rRNA processing protein [Rhizophlyctis rosea]|nr:pre-rRNA processing protein [Rhizophlyctis rosea]
MDDFFVNETTVDPDARPLSQKKRKRAESAARAAPVSNRNRRNAGRNSDEEASDDEMGGGVDDMNLEADHAGEEESEEDRETAAQKRLRLAKRYLSKVKEEATVVDEGEVDAAAMDRDIIADRLRTDALETAGKLFTPIGDKYSTIDFSTQSRIRAFKPSKKGHQLSICSVAFASPRSASTTPSSQKPLYIYSTSKDATIVKWDFYSGRTVKVFEGGLKPTKRIVKALGKSLRRHEGHNDQILACAVSSDGEFLATGGMDKTIHIWSVADDKHLSSFKQHRDAVSSLAFRRGTNQLYSASYDRTVKLWNVDELAYIETLFGHQDRIPCIDTLTRERCITSGSRDCTVRLWKIVEESQLIFRGGGGGFEDDLVVMDGLKKKDKKGDESGGSLDVVAMIDEETFVSGGDAGAISLWSVNRKKPLFTKLNAHGPRGPFPAHHTSNPDAPPTSTQEQSWITSLATVRYTDMFASGAGDGYIRVWKLNEAKRAFSMLNVIPMSGFVNSLHFFEAPPLPSDSDTDSSLIPSTSSGDSSSTIPASSALTSRAHEILARAKKTPTTADVLYLAVGVGQEHRLGRWWRDKSAKNGVRVVRFG